MTTGWQGVAALVSAVFAALSGSGNPAPIDDYGWPLYPQPAVVHPFEAPPQPWAAGHRGVDLKGDAGQPVLAAGAGTVSFSGVIAGRGVIAIQHPDGRRTTYEPVDDRDPLGTVEVRGDRIGSLAAGGHCGSTPCLHWGLLVGKDAYRDPLMLVQDRRVRLLPLG
ncbi:M23 family metallopeptidase [Flexivirga alba]|uniref:M23 family metallopeptidase n=1 Tax=Flexivirga alba TaxID=702742 RepID=A0ABW2AHN3_9MICO